MSASLPGVSVPILLSSALSFAPSNGRELDDLLDGQQLRQVLLAGPLARQTCMRCSVNAVRICVKRSPGISVSTSTLRLGRMP